ncbi:hypothetical protein [Pseudorhodoferax sp.]|uniref:hypothetical protein n=1 Tax=Pseudorhodoferax sp. TaxID=1993553 RepID=UPI002DD69664|nr:hypothetical protein [Pseudorhodoferax sp.]
MSALALQAAPVLPLPQAWWLGTHRRLDLLDVPSFGPPRPGRLRFAVRAVAQRTLHRLPTHLPEELLDLGAYLGAQRPAARLAPLQALSLLLRHLAAPISFQADNPYTVHQAVPSPRCAYPCRVLVIERHARGVRQWAYENGHHALSPLPGPCDAQALLGPARLAIIGIARHWALADSYGDFAPFNSMLEAGMAQAQLQHLAAALGWAGEPLEADAHALRAASGLCEHPLETVAYGLRTDTPRLADDPAWPGPAASTAVAGIEPSPRLADHFDRLPLLAAQFAAIGCTAAVAPATALPMPASVPVRGLLDVMRARSSGNDRSGLAPRLTPLPAGTRADLLALWRALAGRRTRLPGEESLQPLLLWLETHPGPAGLHGLDGRQRELPPGTDLHTLLQQSLPNPRVRHNLAALKCHAMWCVDLDGAQARHGPAALRRLHLAAGAQAQDFSLAATAHGLFARPVRMLREQVLEGGLGLPGPLVYQVMCGLNRSTNTRWQL